MKAQQDKTGELWKTPEAQAAWAQVTQPKMTLQQTSQGLVPVMQQPNIPAGWGPPQGAATASPSASSMAPASPTGNGVPPQAQATGGTGVGGVQAGAAIPGTRPAPTEMQARNAAIGKIVLNEIPTVNKNFQALADPKGQLLSTLGPLGNAWQSTEYQQAATAVTTSVANVLYSLSGASSNPGEVIKQVDVLTPKFGDKPETIAAKLQRFNTYANSIAQESGDQELIAATKQATAAIAAPVQQAPATKTLNGVTYFQQNGQWFTQ